MCQVNINQSGPHSVEHKVNWNGCKQAILKVSGTYKFDQTKLWLLLAQLIQEPLTQFRWIRVIWIADTYMMNELT